MGGFRPTKPGSNGAGARGRFYKVVDLMNRLEIETRSGRQGRLASSRRLLPPDEPLKFAAGIVAARPSLEIPCLQSARVRRGAMAIFGVIPHRAGGQPQLMSASPHVDVGTAEP